MKAKSEISESPVRILKIGSCPSMSGQSTLEYQVGCDTDGNIQFKITGNSGGGFFNAIWVSWNSIQIQLDLQPKDKPITSHSLHPLFRGRSLNNAAFVFAVLKAEGLIQVSPEKQRCHERTDPAAFLDSMKALVDSGIDQPAPTMLTLVEN